MYCANLEIKSWW